MKITSVCQIRDNVLAVFANRERPQDGAITHKVVAWGVVATDEGDMVCGLTMQSEDARLVPVHGLHPDFICYSVQPDMIDYNAYAQRWIHEKYPNG